MPASSECHNAPHSELVVRRELLQKAYPTIRVDGPGEGTMAAVPSIIVPAMNDEAIAGRACHGLELKRSRVCAASSVLTGGPEEYKREGLGERERESTEAKYQF